MTRIAFLALALTTVSAAVTAEPPASAGAGAEIIEEVVSIGTRRRARRGRGRPVVSMSG